MSCAFARHSLRNIISDKLCHANHALGRNQQAGCADIGPKQIRGTADRAHSAAPSNCDPLVRSFLFHSIGGGGAGGLGCGGTNYDIAAASAPLHSTRRETKIDQDQRELPTPDRRGR